MAAAAVVAGARSRIIAGKTGNNITTEGAELSNHENEQNLL
jgi:hypothetical protein